MSRFTRLGDVTEGKKRSMRHERLGRVWEIQSFARKVVFSGTEISESIASYSRVIQVSTEIAKEGPQSTALPFSWLRGVALLTQPHPGAVRWVCCLAKGV